MLTAWALWHRLVTWWRIPPAYTWDGANQQYHRIPAPEWWQS